MPPVTPVRLLVLLFFAGGSDIWRWQGVVEAAPADPTDLIYEVWLDKDEEFLMRWTPEKERIVIEIQVATQGWVGIGFSPTGSMEDSDMIIAWVDDSTGKTTLHDRFADTESTPTIDASQDYELLGGRQSEGHTVIRFARPWVTCDTQFDLELSGDTQKVIWAYGSEDPEDLMHFSWHHHYSTKNLLLLEPPTNIRDKILEGAKTWDMLSPNVLLPEESDAYYCSLHEIPSLETKHHIIGFKPIIEEKNVDYVHHLVIHQCTGDKEALSPHLNNSFSCYGPDMQLTVNSCEMPVTAWAVGSEGDVYPENTGFPFGDTQYFLLEVHYSNSKMKKGIRDSSGIQVLFTDKLREFEAGTLLVGQSPTPEMVIPPGQTWITTVHCPGSCTEQIIPSSGIKVFGSLLHTHLLGTSVSVRIIRDGKELSPIFKDEKFDFNYQQTRKLPVEFTIKPGDDILVDCKYDSRSRKNVSYGGLTASEEMCFIFMYIYPRLSSAGCYSRTRLGEILSVLNITHISYGKADFVYV